MIKKQIVNKEVKLDLKKIEDDDLFYLREFDKQKQNRWAKHQLRIIPDKYIFSPYSILGSYLYLNAETTRLLFLARWFRFCTHKQSCAEKIIRTFGSLIGSYIAYFTLFKSKEKEKQSIKWEVFKAICLIGGIGLFMVRGCI